MTPFKSYITGGITRPDMRADFIRLPKADFSTDPEWLEAVKADASAWHLSNGAKDDPAKALAEFTKLLDTDPAKARLMPACWRFFKVRGFEL